MFKKFLILVLTLSCVTHVFAEVPDQCPGTNAFIHGGIAQSGIFVDSTFNNDWIINPSEDPLLMSPGFIF